MVGEGATEVGNSSSVMKSSLGVKVYVTVCLEMNRLCPVRGEEL